MEGTHDDTHDHCCGLRCALREREHPLGDWRLARERQQRIIRRYSYLKYYRRY
jgi:hypothetical protein